MATDPDAPATDDQRRKRGRPRNADTPSIAIADLAIARAVHQLASWGFSIDSQIAAAVANAAAEVKGRTVDGAALGPDSVVKLHKQWVASANGLAAEPGGWRRDGKQIPLRPWSSMKLDWLVERRPNGWSLKRLAAELMRNDGIWPHERPRYLGDPSETDLTASARARSTPVPKLEFQPLKAVRKPGKKID